MAVQLPAALLHVSWRDESESLATTRVSLSPIAVAEAIAAAADLVETMRPATGCTCTGYSIVYPYYVSDAPASGPQLRHQVGMFVFRCDGTDQWLTLTVPGIAESLIDPNPPGVEIITTAPAIQTLVQAVIDGQLCNPFGYQVIALETAFVQFIP
jgi:hypothetical protein